MGMLDGLSVRGPISYSDKAPSGAPAAGFLPTLGSMPSSSGLQISQGTAIGVSTVYACVMDAADCFARCTPQLLDAKLGRSGEPNTSHPVAKLFRRPNWVQTWYEFAVQMCVAYKLRNNAYAVILRKPNGDPQYLIPVNPDCVQTLESLDGQVFYQVMRQGLFQMDALRSLPMAIPAEDVIHLRSLTFNMLVGASTIGLARDSIGLAMGLEQQASRFMSNGARPSGVLQSKKTLTKDAAARLREQWETMRSGIQNAGKTAILEDEIEWKPMQLTSVDLEFIEQRKLQREDIAMWFGTPLYRIGMMSELGRTSLEDADQFYVNKSIMPITEAWEQKFAFMFDLDAEGLVPDFDERNLLRASESTRINNQRLKVMSGLETQNEARKEEGRPPLDGGDVLLRPVNLASSGSDMSGTAPDAAGRPEGGKLPDPGAANQEGQDAKQGQTGKEAKTVVAEYIVEKQSDFVRNTLASVRATEGDDE